MLEPELVLFVKSSAVDEDAMAFIVFLKFSCSSYAVLFRFKLGLRTHSTYTLRRSLFGRLGGVSTLTYIYILCING